jgi:AraC-like DNA-binding protein
LAANNNFFKYLTPSSDDKSWGLYLNVAGYAHVAPNDAYPPIGHPAGYNFNWENGRILHEFQLNYITEGSGTLETRGGRHPIQPGTVLFLFPGMWHRYRPHKKTGWKEHFLGFLGDFTQHIFQEKFISRQKPILYIGFQDKVVQQFFEIVEHIKEEKPGYQQVCSGITLHMISNMLSINKNREFSGKELEKKIRKACILLRENLNKNVNIEQMAHASHIGYSHFRRAFKKYTGLSPAQYHLQLRLQKARDLLLTTNKSVKQIAFELGFQSNYYFTRIFTQKMGETPTGSRMGVKGKEL